MPTHITKQDTDFTANQIPYATDADTLGAEAGFTYNPSTNRLNAPALDLAAGSATAAPLKLTAGTSLTTPESGAVEYDGTSFFATATDTRRVIRLASDVKTTTTTVANTTTETEVFRASITANTLTAGRVIHANVLGFFSTANGTDTFTIRLKIGSTTVISITSTAANVTNTPLDIDFTFTVRSTGATGSVIAFAKAQFDNAGKSAANTSATTIDTTIAEDVVMTLQWSAANASNTASITQGWLEVDN